MTGYLIKSTYKTGRHAGESYFLLKGRRVTDLESCHWEDDVYLTELACRRVCTRLQKQTKLEHEWELRKNEFKQARGLTVWDQMIHELMDYEPYRIDDVIPEKVFN